MRRTISIFRTGLAITLSLLFWGCAGKTTDQAPKLSDTGQHPATWVNTHWSEYAKNPDQCAPCHGSAKDPALAGGTSKVSCFSCHASGPGHPISWPSSSQHGRNGAQLAAADWAGMASCGRCHGSDLMGGLTPTSCKSCHTKAPHPNAPWRNTDPTMPNHDATDPSNASQCAKCHTNGANSTRVPTTPAPAGTSPGCYNNTLCHDRNP